jgi:glutathione S-transferase
LESDFIEIEPKRIHLTLGFFLFPLLLYASLLTPTEGTSKHAKAFNCVQRSHQQMLETLPGYFITVLVTGLEYPVVAFVLASGWLVSRMVWVKGYAASMGDASKRYSHPLSHYFWDFKLGLLAASWLVAVQLVLGRKIFW